MARIFKPSIKRKPVSSDKAPARLLIDSFSIEGRGVAKHQSKTVFVEGALPEEDVSVAHYRRHKRYSECSVKKVLSPSAYRVKPTCSYFGVCGGCQLQYLATSQQVLYKQTAVINDLVHHLGTDDFQVLEPIASSENYRSRARMVVSQHAQLCFRKKQSDQLVPITQCQVFSSTLQPFVPTIQHWLNSLSPRSGVTHIEFVDSHKGVAIVVRHVKPLSLVDRQQLQDVCDTHLAQVWFQPEKGGALNDAKGSLCDPRLFYDLPKYDIQISFHPSDFTQVNQAVNLQMVDQAISWLDLKPSDKVLDLFCGVGNFTLPIALHVAAVIGIEGVATMSQRATDNASLNQIENAVFKTKNLDADNLGLALESFSVNKFLLDPPRSGALKVCEQLTQSGVESGVYISCNPTTFIRDIIILRNNGFKLKAIRMLDMFLHTSHIETMALFEKVS
jgi:23S rRNA (uracil1939-C5)-methyltransferase